MKRHAVCFLAVTLLFAAACGQDELEPLPDVAQQNLAAMVQANNQFALELYRELASTAQGDRQAEIKCRVARIEGHSVWS